SSRNRYLDADQRDRALALSRALIRAREHGAEGAEAALAHARAELRSAHGIDLDYLVITTPELEELPSDLAPGTEARVLIAARVGATRLIDNMPITLGTNKGDS
ncbi:MAG TPA: pantoate--beta-alanine ligase, partial [Marmoricola sp.]|nr:pantoate--beta-alanine ligase [Marmoricola sp.]